MRGNVYKLYDEGLNLLQGGRHGVSDAGSRLLFRSGTHRLNEELGRHREKEGKVDVLCVVLSVRV